jgi:integrase
MSGSKKKVKLTKKRVDSLSFVRPGEVSASGKAVRQVDYFDADLPGFGVRVSGRTKTYFVMGRVCGKLSRVKLGTHGIMTAEEARHEARDKLNALGRGHDVNALKAKERAAKITLGEVLEQYIEDRTLRPNTILDYRKVLRLYVSDWLKKSMIDISSAMIEARHKKIKNKIGPVPANKLARYLRLLFNFAIKSPSISLDIATHPVAVQWGQEKRRRTFLNASQLPIWVQAVKKLESPMMQDYFMLLLYTGLRKNEALSLRWEDVNFEECCFTVRGDVAKNKDEHTLPITRQLQVLFERREAVRENEFVFPGVGKTGHLAEPRKQIERIELETQMSINGIGTGKEWKQFLEDTPPHKIRPGIKFCNHDLRRTFSSIAEALVSYSQMKMLLNHSTKADVTAGYIVIDLEKLRQPSQAIADEIDALSSEKKGSVIPFRQTMS